MKVYRRTQFSFLSTGVGIAVLVALIGLAAADSPASRAPEESTLLDFTDAPAGFLPPPLHPRGVELTTRELAPGVYALLSDRPPVDNSGFVVGERGVLVIDAHINGEMANKIQAAVRRVTDKPILFLVNTNYHGDHTFGNYAFPAETWIIAHRNTAERMRSFAHEKQFMLQTVENDTSVFGDARLRLPDVVFEDFLRLDLGGRVIELHHFGRGNTTGDTVVYVPDAKAAWTGNLVVGGIIPPVFEGHAEEYLQTIARFAASLDVQTIVPGHGGLKNGTALSKDMNYLTELLTTVRAAVAAGQGLKETLAQTPISEDYLPPADSPLAQLRPVIQGFHRLAVQLTHQELIEQRRENRSKTEIR